MEEYLTYTITQLSEMLGISDATIRKYEKDYNIKVPRNDLGHRYYTANEVEVFQLIMKYKDNGANIHVINKMLARSDSFEEQKEQVLELVTLDKLTGAEFKELMMKQIAEIIVEKEQELAKQYESKLDSLKEDLKEEIKLEFTRQQEQRESENKKLMDYIASQKEEKKSFWSFLKNSKPK